MNRRHGDENRFDHRLLIGIGFLIAGLVVLSKYFGFFDNHIHDYILQWPVILIILGLIFIISKGNRSAGVILLVIGGVFYLRNIYHFSFSFWQIFWPSLLILAGVMIIFRHRIDSDKHRIGFKKYDDDFIDEVAVFGGGDRVVTSQQFKGGKVTAIFGGLTFDMLDAKLASGENYIDVFCLFGGMKLIVPENWSVRITVLSLFGGFGGQHRYKSTVTNPDNNSRLIIKGTVIFGGGDIKNHPD